MFVKEKTYRNYVTECLKNTVNNTANFAGGSQIKQSFYDLYVPDRTEENHKEAEDIIESLKRAFEKKGGGDI